MSPFNQIDLTIAEVAALGNISVKTVRRLIAAGKLKVLIHGARAHRVPHDSWNAYRSGLLRAKYPRNVHVSPQT